MKVDELTEEEIAKSDCLKEEAFLEDAKERRWQRQQEITEESKNKQNGQINERYPWRYRCPDCGSTSIIRRSGRNNPTARQAAKMGLHSGISHRGNTASGQKIIRMYVCRRCNTNFDTPRDIVLEINRGSI